MGISTYDPGKASTERALLCNRCCNRAGNHYAFYERFGGPCDFVIKCNEMLVFVTVRKALRLCVTLEEIEREFREPFIYLGSFPVSDKINRELWTYSRRGRWRLFRVEKTGIVEICQNGTPVKEHVHRYYTVRP